MNLNVWIEILGKDVAVGTITGNSAEDAVFQYTDSYINSGYLPISISLQFQQEPFSPEQTRKYFDGLLPEGFTRQSVALKLHSDEGDYLKLLRALGRECLGAIRIEDSNSSPECDSAYEKLSLDNLKALASEGATKSTELITRAHLSLAGASGKVGLYYDNANNAWYLPTGRASSTHIVKQSHVRLSNIVVNEQLALMTAKKLGIAVPDSFIVSSEGVSDGDVLLALARYDRIITEKSKLACGLPVPLRLHQEDFAQAIGVAAKDKYETLGKHYLNDMMQILRLWSANPIEDQLRLWDVVAFNYLIGNTDNHIKNISLAYSPDMRSIRLAPAYDLISTVVYESSSLDMSFAINGKYDITALNRDDFKAAAVEAGLGSGMPMKRFDAIAKAFPAALADSAAELKDKGMYAVDEIMSHILRMRN